MEPGTALVLHASFPLKMAAFSFFLLKLSLILLFFSRMELAYAILKKFEKYPFFPISERRME